LPFGNYALTRIIKLIKEIYPNAVEKNMISWVKKTSQEKKTVLISHEFIEKKLGVKLNSEEVEEILKKLQFPFQKKQF
jgi:phenylalanyl-tRNA synthetase beta subunit